SMTCRSRRASGNTTGRSAAGRTIIPASATLAFSREPHPQERDRMDAQPVYSSDVAFTPTVKAIQARRGSRQGYASMERRGGWRTTITPDLAAFIGEQVSVFLATVNAAGQPYIQHRGGPAGFLRVLDERTIAFADFAGNRQYITSGNLADNAKAHLF